MLIALALCRRWEWSAVLAWGDTRGNTSRMDENITHSPGGTWWDRRDVNRLVPDKWLRLLISQEICGHWRLMHVMVTSAALGRDGGGHCVWHIPKHGRITQLGAKTSSKVTFFSHYQILTIHPTLQRSSRATLISQNLCSPSEERHNARVVFFQKRPRLCRTWSGPMLQMNDDQQVLLPVWQHELLFSDSFSQS